MPSPRGVALEHNMREALILFIKENRGKVTTIASPFLKKKKLPLDEYIAFMSTPGNWGISWHTSPCYNESNTLLCSYKDKDILQPPGCISQSISCTHSTCVLRKQHLPGYYNSSKKMPTSILY